MRSEVLELELSIQANRGQFASQEIEWVFKSRN